MRVAWAFKYLILPLGAGAGYHEHGIRQMLENVGP
jgi:hypothetical protein